MASLRGAGCYDVIKVITLFQFRVYITDDSFSARYYLPDDELDSGVLFSPGIKQIDLKN